MFSERSAARRLRACAAQSPFALPVGLRQVARALLRAGARADACDADGRLPIDVAADEHVRDELAAALDEQYEDFSEHSYDSAQDDRPWH